MDYGFIDEIQKFIEDDKHSIELHKYAIKQFSDRKNGKEYSLSEHVEAIIWALLSNQQKWWIIWSKLEQIKEIFYNYKIENILLINPCYFAFKIIEIGAANMNIKIQMEGLGDIILTLQRIAKREGSIDKYYNSLIEKYKSVDVLLEKLTGCDDKKPYKLKNMGIPLICEYLKNIGIDTGKPDTHIKRILGSNILGFSQNEEATEKESLSYIKEISDNKGITQKEVDSLLWLYCADGFGEICKRNEPKCIKCVIKKYCRKQVQLRLTNGNCTPPCSGG
jgi:endonuclease III